ncbi:hypothetical protein [Microcoleus sp. T3_D1]|uniref:hypothetical protein n=1 Tax=Microcoleus sp. T3_D1 TaxID=3055427 RepID=UPI002FCF2115
MPVPQENSIFVEQASCLCFKYQQPRCLCHKKIQSLWNRHLACALNINSQDVCATRKFNLCGTGILPVL